MSNYLYRFTVFTRTYNRAHTLHRVYDSLVRQTFKDFEWLIVDDGSTDNTHEMVEAWQKIAAFPIRYIWQENQQNKVANNRGIAEAQGELLLFGDSDDEFTPEAMERLDFHWKAMPENIRSKFVGITGLCRTTEGAIVGNRFPSDIFDSDSREAYYRYHIRGDKAGFQHIDVIRQFPYPENIVGFVPDGLAWWAIARHYKTRFVNETFRIVHTENDSLGKSTNYKRVADGTSLWTREVLKYDWPWICFDPKDILKTAANYTRFHKHLQDSQPGKRWPLHGIVPHLLVALMWPVGCACYWRDKKRMERA